MTRDNENIIMPVFKENCTLVLVYVKYTLIKCVVYYSFFYYYYVHLPNCMCSKFLYIIFDVLMPCMQRITDFSETNSFILF